MLVVFAWCRDEDPRLAIILSEHMNCDTTFSAKKEQRNIFIVTGIDGHNKVFTTIRCFMSSKETKAYHWEMITALQHPVTDTILSFNQCIVCHQETDIYQTLRIMMKNVPCIYKHHNRLDKNHLVTQRWVDRVMVIIIGKESKTILKIFYQCYHIFQLPRE